MESETLEEKRLEAMRATNELIEFLIKNKLSGWAERFTQLFNHLQNKDLTGAIHLRKMFSYAGPGSLSDFMLENQAEFDVLLGRQDKAIGNMRMYIEYGVNRASLYKDT